MELLYKKCEYEKCQRTIPYLEDQVLIPKYCHFHFPLYAHVYFKKKYNKII